MDSLFNNQGWYTFTFNIGTKRATDPAIHSSVNTPISVKISSQKMADSPYIVALKNSWWDAGTKLKNTLL